MKFRRLLGCLAVATCLAGVPACGGCGSGKPQVAFVTNNPESFWNIAEAGCRKAESEEDVEVVFKRPSKGDPAIQGELIDSLVRQKVKALAVSVIDPKGQKEHLNEVAAKVPLLTQDNDAPESKRLCYIGTNNYAAGRTVGKLVKEAMPEGGAIAIFVGSLDPLNARQRRQGVLDELADHDAPDNINEFENSEDGKTYGKYRLHKTYTDQPEGSKKAVENASTALKALGQEDHVCMVGLWAYNPPAILTALKDKDKEGKVKVVGFDEDETTLQGIADGHIYATVVQDPYQFGYQAVKMMAAIARGDRSSVPSNGLKYIDHRIIAKDAGEKDGMKRLPVAEFRKELHKLLGKD
jgi:ribose transport system substrate-binding protein